MPIESLSNPNFLGGVELVPPVGLQLLSRGKRRGEGEKHRERAWERGGEKGSCCLYTSVPSWGGGGAAGLHFCSPCEQRSAVEI